MTAARPHSLILLTLCLLTACGDKDDTDTGDDGGAGTTDSTSGTGAGDDGGDDGGGSASDGDPDRSPAQQFLWDYGMRGCDLYLECSPPEALEYYPYETCVQQVEQAVAAWPGEVCTFNDAAAAECMAWINSVDCDGYSGDAPEACSQAYSCPE